MIISFLIFVQENNMKIVEKSSMEQHFIQWGRRKDLTSFTNNLEINNDKGIYNVELYADEELFKIKSCNDTARIMFKLEHDL
jgi:hypothetical protein